MGCHTWFYKLSEINSTEKVIDKAIELLSQIKDDPERQDSYNKQHVKLIELAIDNHLDEIIGEFVGVNEGHCCVYQDGKIWIDTDIHDIFRIGGYPSDKLFSYDETIKYCTNKGMQLTSEQEIKLKEFWELHPDGMIAFD